MTIKTLARQWYTITDIINNQLIYRQYMYHNKKDAIRLFKAEFPNCDKTIYKTTFNQWQF